MNECIHLCLYFYVDQYTIIFIFRLGCGKQGLIGHVERLEMTRISSQNHPLYQHCKTVLPGLGSHHINDWVARRFFTLCAMIDSDKVQ